VLSPELDSLMRALQVELHVDPAHGFPPGYTPFMLAVEVMKVLNAEGWELRRAGVGEVRVTQDPEPDGSLDDLVIEANGVMLHVERMDTGHWWLALYTPDGVQHAINFHSSRKIHARYETTPN
jgi:hypothetical protein